MKNQSFLKLVSQNPNSTTYKEYEFLPLSGAINVSEWGVLADPDIYKIIYEDDDSCKKGKVYLDNIPQCFFHIAKNGINVSVSETFLLENDIVFCVGSNELIISPRVLPSKF